MKEFESVSPAQDKELAIVQNQKQHKLVGQMRKVPGLTLFDFDPHTKKIVPAEYEEVVDLITKTIVKKVIIKQDHFYLQALNIKNAARKISKMS